MKDQYAVWRTLADNQFSSSHNPMQQVTSYLDDLSAMIGELQHTIETLKSDIEKRDKYIAMLERHIKIAENALTKQDKWQND
jgi:peptidoglycan hydrolase CwlO-like protein